MRSIATTIVNHIAAPVERVFELLTTCARIPDWLPGCTAVTAQGPIKKGSRLNVSFGERETTFEVVDFAAPHTFGWVEKGARKGCKTFFRLDFAGSITAVTIRDVWEPPSLGALVRAKLRPRRYPNLRLDSTLQNLRFALTA
jgi:uncharacterized protein YndB with AHSA1/START domain